MSNQVVPRQVSDPVDAQPCPVCWWHIGIGVVIALLGGVMIMTGALVSYGIVTLTIGIFYAAVAWIVSMIPSKHDPDAIP